MPPSDDVMMTGFLVAGFFWTLWWNLDWRRYLKFYGINGPTYPAWVQVPFRAFFGACSLGTGVALGRQLLHKGRSIRFYSHCLLAAACWFAVIVFMVVVAESFNRNREKRATTPHKD
jgi:hypothetical protein